MSLTRRRFLKQCAAAGAAAATLPATTHAQTSMKPNIIWVVAEDMCPDLGCYGHPLVKTPNIDKLAAEGIMYTNACATSPVCSPTRSAFFTGMYQTSIDVHNHRSHHDDGYTLPNHVRLLSDYLRDAGYFSMMMGPKQKTDFNFTPVRPPFDATDDKKSVVLGAYTHAPIGTPIFDGPAWRKYPGDRPFFAQINYSEAHRTFVHDPQDPISPDDVEVPPYYPDHPITRRDWALYLETVQVLDKKIGTLMKEIEEKGLTENTVIFFFGDHGRPMLRDKQWLYEGGIHVPLIVHWPGHIKPGQVCNDPVSLIDLCPTTLDIAGVEPPDYMDGKVFLGPNAEKRDYVFAARDRCDETDDRIRCVRSTRYKYIRNFFPQVPYTQFNAYKKLEYPVLTLMEIMHEKGELTPVQARWMGPSRPVEELYDLEKDPHEINNLAKDPAHKSVLMEMRATLDTWICETGDDGQLPEDPEIAFHWDRFFKEYYEQGLRDRGLSPDISNQEYLDWWDKELARLGKP